MARPWHTELVEPGLGSWLTHVKRILDVSSTYNIVYLGAKSVTACLIYNIIHGKFASSQDMKLQIICPFLRVIIARIIILACESC